MKIVNKSLLIYLFLFMIISVVSIYSSELILVKNNNFFIKQLIWYFIGFIIIFLITKIGNRRIYDYIPHLYIISNVFLLLLLMFASPINEAKCWFRINGIGTVQPSEFTKITLILLISSMCSKFREKYNNPSIKEEFIFLLKIFFILLPPSLLTFLEPDTGVVIIYFLITFVILFICGIRYRWFFILLFIIALLLGFILGIYFINQNLFISIFGNSFFLRINRLLDWTSKSGYQLKNSLILIGSGGLFGHGFNNKLYVPESQTDFIFSILCGSFGFVGTFITLLIIGLFDYKLISIGINTNKKIDKYIISGIVGMLIYQQFQNIGMTIGLLPITGITLPFISYGGSSLLSYMIMIGLIINI